MAHDWCPAWRSATRLGRGRDSRVQRLLLASDPGRESTPATLLRPGMGQPSGMTPELVSLLPVHGAGSGPWAFDRWSCVPCASRWTLRVRCIHGRGHGRTRRLVVLPTEVVNAADRRTVSEGAVGPVPVVVLEPVWQRLVALSMRAVDNPLGPLAPHGLVEALDLPVGARTVRLGGQVPDPVSGEQVAQGVVLDVAEGVVGHQPFRREAMPLEEGEPPLDEAGYGRGPLVAVQLDVSEARVVVDERVRVVVADPAIDLGARA